MGAMDEGGGMENLLGEVIARAGLRQLRIAETQKFRHVTSFFNGKSTKPYPGEDQVEVQSRFDPATVRQPPGDGCRSGDGGAAAAAGGQPLRLHRRELRQRRHGGAHGQLRGGAGRPSRWWTSAWAGSWTRLLELDAHILITADHGNSEQMVDYDTGMVKTSHTLNPVECIYVARDAPGRRLAAARQAGGHRADRRCTCWACRCPPR